MDNIPWISSKEIKRILTWEKLVPAIQEGIESVHRGPDHPNGAILPLRSFLTIGKQDGHLLMMPAYSTRNERLAVKIACLHPRNVENNLPIVYAFVTLMDWNTGKPLLLLEGTSITDLRTAATSVLVTKSLVQKKNATVAILGSGAQGSSHARAMYYAFKPCKINVWSRTRKNALHLIEELSGEGIPAVCSSSVEEAVKEADIINTCTTSADPILFKNWIKDGAHINVVGACEPHKQEIEPSIMTSSDVYVDSLDGAFAESGQVIKAGVKNVTEIVELFSSPPRSDASTTVFINLGIAIEDLAAVSLVYDELRREGKISC